MPTCSSRRNIKAVFNMCCNPATNVFDDESFVRLCRLYLSGDPVLATTTLAPSKVCRALGGGVNVVCTSLCACRVSVCVDVCECVRAHKSCV